jgi:2-amino-4-hydroxy-6-hydroxymethyldihydropteridine diphosphokinase
MENVFLLLGTNLGDRVANLNSARNLIAFRAGQIIASSSIYETAPWGKTDQPGFLNQCLAINTLHSPEELLRILQKTEKEIGRESTEKWGPRLIDIDILFYEDQTISLDQLTIPHPYMHQRKFTLLPLSEIAANFMHPILNTSVKNLLEVCEDQSDVTLYELCV